MNPRERIAAARLYLVCDARPRDVPRRRRSAAASTWSSCATRRSTTTDLVAAAREFRAAADAHGALFVLNDRPDLVAACGADGVHVGQDDGAPAAARAARRPGARSSAARRTRRRRRDAAEADPDVDYLAVGPVHATPTKPGPPGRRARLRRLRGRADAQAVVRDRRAGRGQRGEVVARGRDADRRRARDRRAPPTPRRRRARCAPRWRSGWASAAVSARAGRAPAPPAPAGDDGCARGYARARARNDAVRAKLEPLAPGERPLAVTIAAVLALAIAVANLVLYLAGCDVRGEDPTAGGALVVLRGLVVAAARDVARAYWAVLGFEVAARRR